MFFVNETEIFNFADDTTIYSSSLNYEESNQKLSNVTYVVLNWFRINITVANPGKFQMFLGSSIYNSNITYLVENKHIKGSNEFNFWESPLMINLHLQNINICNVASNRLRAFTRIRKFLSQEQAFPFI